MEKTEFPVDRKTWHPLLSGGLRWTKCLPRHKSAFPNRRRNGSCSWQNFFRARIKRALRRSSIEKRRCRPSCFVPCHLRHTRYRQLYRCRAGIDRIGSGGKCISGDAPSNAFRPQFSAARYMWFGTPLAVSSSALSYNSYTMLIIPNLNVTIFPVRRL